MPRTARKRALAPALLAALLTPPGALAQAERNTSTYVFPVQMWVERDVIDRWAPPPRDPELRPMTMIDGAVARAAAIYREDIDGSGTNDVACDIAIARDWIALYAVGERAPYAAGACRPADGRFQEPRTSVRLPLESTGPGSPCLHDVFVVHDKGTANVQSFARRGQWMIEHVTYTSPSAANGRWMAHEHGHLVGQKHADPGCNHMKYPRCPGCVSPHTWEACIEAGHTPGAMRQSLSRVQCDQLLRDPAVRCRRDWELERLDCSGDRSVDTGDVLCWSQAVRGAIFDDALERKELDCNYDGRVGVEDLWCANAWIQEIGSRAGPLPCPCISPGHPRGCAP